VTAPEALPKSLRQRATEAAERGDHQTATAFALASMAEDLAQIRADMRHLVRSASVRVGR
jgi:hypothetical protein